jgi:uncharacterized membrane protein
MLIKFEKYPITIILCLVWSIIDLFLILFNAEDTIRTIIGIPMIIFIPGYVLIYALFPTKKTDRGIDEIERLALSFALSIAIVPLIGLVLNYTTWGIRLIPLLISLELFILTIGLIAIYRWYRTTPENRYKIIINISFPKHESKIDKTLSIILGILIVTSLCLLVYAIVSPKIGERFTEFYILGPNYIADYYPSNLTTGENASVIIGIINHEYKTSNYTIEVWLSNQTTLFNITTNQNETIYNNLWFLDKINVTLEHKPLNLEEKWSPQWEYNYTFNITHKGYFKLVLLLYKNPTENYSKNYNYNMIALDKIDSKYIDAYRNIHLWINVV